MSKYPIPPEEHEFSLGASIVDIVSRFESLFPSVSKFSFTTYIPSLNIEEEVKSAEDLYSSQNPKIQFVTEKWNFEEKLVTEILSGSKKDQLLNRLIFHDEEKDRDSNFIAVNHTNIAEWLDIKLTTTPSNVAIGLTSTCETHDQERLHIPMMDFACPTSVENLEFIKWSLKKIGCSKGIILNSGRSYHFYGFELLTLKDWYKFMGKCLLISPFTDNRYIAHRIISERTILRINSTILKKQIPYVVAFL